MGAPLPDKPIVNVVRKDYARGAPIPWQAKMWVKIILSKLRFSYGFWSALGIFKHGEQGADVPTLKKAFEDHLNFYKERFGKVPSFCLELGPGDSVGHALAAKANDIGGMWFIDVGDFATKDTEHYEAVAKSWGMEGEKLPPSFDRDEMLAFCGSHYGTDGLKAFERIEGGSIEFSFSHAVLEHIRRYDFDNYMKDLYRTQKSGTCGRHWVDLHDHLGGALNNMRFSEKFWEGDAVGGAGFYTNRLTMEQMIKSAEKAGYQVEIQRINKWESLPTPRDKMNTMFQDISEEELNVCTFLMILYKA